MGKSFYKKGVRDVRAEDVVEFYGINARRIFSMEPQWFKDAVDDGVIFLDDSDEKLKVKTGTAGTLEIVEPGGFIIRQTLEDGSKQMIVEN